MYLFVQFSQAFHFFQPVQSSQLVLGVRVAQGAPSVYFHFFALKQTIRKTVTGMGKGLPEG